MPHDNPDARPLPGQEPQLLETLDPRSLGSEDLRLRPPEYYSALHDLANRLADGYLVLPPKGTGWTVNQQGMTAVRYLEAVAEYAPDFDQRVSARLRLPVYHLGLGDLGEASNAALRVPHVGVRKATSQGVDVGPAVELLVQLGTSFGNAAAAHRARSGNCAFLSCLFHVAASLATASMGTRIAERTAAVAIWADALRDNPLVPPAPVRYAPHLRPKEKDEAYLQVKEMVTQASRFPVGALFVPSFNLDKVARAFVPMAYGRGTARSAPASLPPGHGGTHVTPRDTRPPL